MTIARIAIVSVPSITPIQVAVPVWVAEGLMDRQYAPLQLLVRLSLVPVIVSGQDRNVIAVDKKAQ